MLFKKPKFWESKNIFSIFLLPFSLLTFLFNTLKKILIKTRSYGIPIICVGNIYLGGTGKTPLSIYIYNFLKRKKYKPALIKKFYKAHKDEIMLSTKKVKDFYYHKNRVESLSKSKRKGRNVIIMDDGFQDISIKKKLNIICFNGRDLIGNGFLIPAGPLRENISNLNKSHIIVINGRKNLKFERKLKSISKDIKIFYSKYIINEIKNLKGKRVMAIAGIGNPDNFFDLLKKNNVKVEEKVAFPDHYNYSNDDLDRMIFDAKKRKLELVTTEKDFLRMKLSYMKKIKCITISLKIDNSIKFEKEILKFL